MNPGVVLLRLISFSRAYFFACVVYATLIYTVVPLLLGVASQALFDALADSAPTLRTPVVIIAVMAAVQLVEVFAGVILRNPWNSLQQNSQVLLRRNLFAAMLRAYGRVRPTESAAETISRFRDDPETIGDALDALCDLIGRTIFAVAAAVLMWRISPLLTGVLFVPLLLSSYVAEALGTKTTGYRAASREATARLTGFLGEVISAQLAINIAGSVSHAVRRLNKLGDERRHLAVRDSVFDQVLNSLSLNIVHLGTGVVLLLGAQSIRDGSFSIGDFALFVVYLDQLTWYPAEIGRLITDLKRIDVSYRRMLAVVPEEAPAALVAPDLGSERAP
ncbi:MAG: ABC transporter ATP-binding protein, partial [Chloroflexi bacterium]|nr:ABC transporter ATP-binding protein [Chloroflexota bacterium]